MADAVLQLQRTAGNAAVVSLLTAPESSFMVQRACACGDCGGCSGREPDGREQAEESAEASVQRWKVESSLECSEVVDWLDSNSPYAPEWAATACTLTFSGKNKIKHDKQPDGTMQSTLLGTKKLKVTAKCPVDPPRWSPTKRPTRKAEVAAWAAMRRVLDAHEKEHRAIGKKTAAEAQDNWRAFTVTVTGADKDDTTAQIVALLQAEQETWRVNAQSQQDAIDPFRGAILACP